MSYELIILPKARKEIDKLPYEIAMEMFETIEILANNPLPTGNKKMNNYSTPRLKVGTFNRVKFKKTIE